MGLSPDDLEYLKAILCATTLVVAFLLVMSMIDDEAQAEVDKDE